MKTAAIIGSGIGGIATSIRLAKMGYRVTVFEKNLVAGGKIAEIHDSGFRFDTGPSLFTLPALVIDLYELCGENPDNFFAYQPIDPVTKYFWDDGTVVTAPANADNFASELEKKLNEPAENAKRFLKKYKELYEVASPVFLLNSFHRLKNFVKPEFKKTLFKLHKLDSVTTMFKRNYKWFFSDKTTQIFNRYATYNGSSPYKAPATLNMISHLEHNLGGYFPEKGMYQIVSSLVKLAEKQGVTFRYNATVEQVNYKNKHIKSIRVNGKNEGIDLLISNADATTFYHKLMPKVKKPRAIVGKELSSSGLIFYWGINRVFPELDLHNILFSNNYKTEFDFIFKRKTIYTDPTVYIFISSKKVKTDAPDGSENWFVMINTPANYNQNWDVLISDARKNIMAKINKRFNINIENHIVSEHVANPLTIEQKTASWKGALYGNSSNGLLSAFNRHANFSRKFKNLYFTGGSVHPGGGIPLCLCSAKIVEDLIREDHKN